MCWSVRGPGASGPALVFEVVSGIGSDVCSENVFVFSARQRYSDTDYTRNEFRFPHRPLARRPRHVCEKSRTAYPLMQATPARNHKQHTTPYIHNSSVSRVQG